MIFKAVGLNPHGRLVGAASRFTWNLMRYRMSRLAPVKVFTAETQKID